MDKDEKKIFLKTVHSYGLNFLDNYLFIRPENLKTNVGSTFAVSKWYMYTFWHLITLCNMPKGLVK